jgi:flavin-dependent dehydrogenase
VVVGGGPAGCAAAAALDEAGVPTLLLERGARGRDKACGDALLPSAVEQIAALGIDPEQLAGLGGRSFGTVEVRDPRFGRLPMTLGGDGTGWLVPRATLDQALRDAVGHRTEVRYETTVVNVGLSDDGGWLVSTTSADDPVLRARAIVLATGATNRIARRWGVSGDPLNAAAVSVYASQPELDAPVFEFDEATRPGYGWVFPIGDGKVNAGACLLGPGRRLHLAARAYLEARVSGIERWRGGGGGLWSGAGSSWHHPGGLVSTGDAAGVADPLNGEGITAALTSGRRAGSAVAQFLLEADDSHLEAYSGWVRAHFEAAYADTEMRGQWARLAGFEGLIA